MRDYGKVSPNFWIGETGKKLREAGTEAQLVALYLMTSPHANMLGLFYLPKIYLAHETGLGFEGASKGLARASEAQFCAYDEPTETVWVFEMACYQVGEQLSEKDNRCAGIQKAYDALPENPFLKGFYDKYSGQFHLSNCRGPSKGLGRGLKAPPKPRAGTGAETGAGVAARKVTLPHDFVLTESLAGYVTAKLPDADPASMFADFCGKAAAKGWKYIDWGCAFQTFVREAKVGSGHFSAGVYPRSNAVKRVAL